MDNAEERGDGGGGVDSSFREAVEGTGSGSTGPDVPFPNHQPYPERE